MSTAQNVPAEIVESLWETILEDVKMSNWACEMAYKDLGYGPNTVIGAGAENDKIQEKVTERTIHWQLEAVKAVMTDMKGN